MQPPRINLADCSLKAISFDVFDTVIARRCGAPETVFRMVGVRLRASGLLAIGPEHFERARMEAERRLRKHHGAKEITLAEIYAELNRLWQLPAKALEQMVACELATEKENLFAIPGMEETLVQVRRAGKRLLFVSDMYLPEDFLRGVLADLNLCEDGDRLYVSSRWGVSKASGELFRVVLESERLAAGEMAHVGDSWRSDYERAKECGMAAICCLRGALNRFETKLAAGEKLLGACASLGGMARQARLTADPAGTHAVAARLGASLAGPLLTLYAEWVLRTALARKLSRLYFLARDGQALLRLCETLAPALGAEGLELRYLYGSREVWSPAAMLARDAGAAEFFAKQVAFAASSWEECVELLGFGRDEVRSHPVSELWAGFKAEQEWKRRVFLDLAADGQFGPKLAASLRLRSALTARYLREQELAEPGRFGLVDCGWSGTWTDLLGDLVEEQGGGRPVVFFLGRKKRSSAPRGETLAFLFDLQFGSGLKEIPDYFHIVAEFLLTADHGRTRGFEDHAGQLVPQLAEVDWQGFQPEDWRVFRAALVGFARIYASQLQPGAPVPELRTELCELVRLFWEEPTVEEARFFGVHAIGLSPNGAVQQSLARPYGVSDFVRLVTRFQLPGYPPFWWHPGAQVLSKPALRVTMGILWEGREQVRRWRDARGAFFDVKAQFREGLRLVKSLQRAWEQRWDREEIPFEGETKIRATKCAESAAVATLKV